MKDDIKLALLEQSIGHINETMLRMEKKFDQVDKRFDQIDKKFDQVDKRFELIDKKLDHERILHWSQFRWIMGGIFGLIFMVIGIYLKGHVG